jgi:hypothetical protein
LYEDRFGIEETFVKVKRREEEHCVTRGIGQESEVMLLVLDIGCWAREMLSDVE